MTIGPICSCGMFCQPENARVDKLEIEQDGPAEATDLALKLELKIGARELVGIDVDLNIDRRLLWRLTQLRSVGVSNERSFVY